jgi:heat shock protein HslJ
VLRSWDWDEAAPPEPEITLQYVEGRFAGQSACNRYFAPVKEKGDVPGALEVGLGAGTMMACPDPAGAMESRFLKQLGGVSSFGFVAGQLSFMYAVDDVVGVMLFEGRPPEPPAGS